MLLLAENLIIPSVLWACLRVFVLHFGEMLVDPGMEIGLRSLYP